MMGLYNKAESAYESADVGVLTLLPTVAPQQPVASCVARDAFMNALRILYSMEPDVPHPGRFVGDPAGYLMLADDETVYRIWDEIQRRQPERFRA